MSDFKGFVFTIIFIGVFCVAAMFMTVGLINLLETNKRFLCVTGKERALKVDVIGETEEKRVFVGTKQYVVDNSIWSFHFDSDELFNNIAVGGCYSVKTRGKDTKVFNMKENIVEAK